MERCGRTGSQAITIQQIGVNYILHPMEFHPVFDDPHGAFQLLTPRVQPISYKESLLADTILQFDSSFSALSKGQSACTLRELWIGLRQTKWFSLKEQHRVILCTQFFNFFLCTVLRSPFLNSLISFLHIMVLQVSSAVFKIVSELLGTWHSVSLPCNIKIPLVRYASLSNHS